MVRHMRQKQTKQNKTRHKSNRKPFLNGYSCKTSTLRNMICRYYKSFWLIRVRFIRPSHLSSRLVAMTHYDAVATKTFGRKVKIVTRIPNSHGHAALLLLLLLLLYKNAERNWVTTSFRVKYAYLIDSRSERSDRMG